MATPRQNNASTASEQRTGRGEYRSPGFQAAGRAAATRGRESVKNGVTEEELVEMITHLAFYVGWPNAMSAVNRAKTLFEKEGA
ncbi:carboxymuconolactone decarboxylase family protein [Archangium lipolyticum]|uniref:carboxymuconolactone decarboxylase family protein n=1 Tax=Archangium lipolyticum TaxID=2970465 RepID=UPI00214A2A92|nr:carboxymuconolactone decarboxylase family protein [Archangium lipolyticum]